MELSVVIPTYNDEKHIKNTVEDIYKYLSVNKPDHEIIVVLDGSRDKSKEIVEKLLSSIPTLKVIHNPVNHGKGFVVRQGMMSATGDIRLFTDADNATTIDHLEKMLPFFNKGFDVVIASIGVKGHKVAAGSEPAWRRLAGKLGNLFIQIMAVPGVRDTQRGFKVFSSRAAKDIFPQITISRFGFDVEVLALARKFGYKIKEVGVNWANDAKSNSRPRLNAYVQVFKDTAKVRWNLWAGKYHFKKKIKEEAVQ